MFVTLFMGGIDLVRQEEEEAIVHQWAPGESQGLHGCIPISGDDLLQQRLPAKPSSRIGRRLQPLDRSLPRLHIPAGSRMFDQLVTQPVQLGGCLLGGAAGNRGEQLEELIVQILVVLLSQIGPTGFLRGQKALQHFQPHLLLIQHLGGDPAAAAPGGKRKQPVPELDQGLRLLLILTPLPPGRVDHGRQHLENALVDLVVMSFDQ